MAVLVKPESFKQVDFDAGEIVRIAGEVVRITCPAVMGDFDVVLDIAENAPTNRAHVASLNPVTFHVQRGALERYSQPGALDDSEASGTLAALFLEVGDRRSDSFGGPGLDEELSHAHRIAWDTNLAGRAARLGFDAHKPRCRYDFRNRHGFTAPADRIFERLWAGNDLTWADIVKASDTAVALVVASRPRLWKGPSGH